MKSDLFFGKYGRFYICSQNLRPVCPLGPHIQVIDSEISDLQWNFTEIPEFCTKIDVFPQKIMFFARKFENMMKNSVFYIHHQKKMCSACFSSFQGLFQVKNRHFVKISSKYSSFLLEKTEITEKSYFQESTSKSDLFFKFCMRKTLQKLFLGQIQRF